MRRFIGRLRYHEMVRLREMERKRRRIKEIEHLISSMDDTKIRQFESIRAEYEDRKDVEKQAIIDNFKLEGRRCLSETRSMESSMLALVKEARQLNLEGKALKSQMEGLVIRIKMMENFSTRLSLVTSKYEELVKRDSQVLLSAKKMCLIESSARRIFQNGMKGIVKRIESADTVDAELVENIRALSLNCEENIVRSVSGNLE